MKDMDGERCLQATPTPAIAGRVNVATGGVSQDDGLNIKEEPTETDLDAGPAALQHTDADTRYRRHKRKVSCVKEERDPLEETSTLESKPFSAKEPLALQVDEDVADSQQDMNGQPCLQATYKPAITMVQDDGLKMKEEWADTDIDIGPTVLQPMDTRYKPVQPDVSIIKQEGRSEDNNINPTRCSGVKEDTSEDERKAENDAQRSNEESQSEQRARSQLYSCDKCGKTYTSNKSLLTHYKNLHSTESHKCAKCNKIFPSKPYLNRHTITVHSEQEHECVVCKKILRSKATLYTHVYRAHRPAVTSPVVHTCEYCHKTYASKPGLSYHINVMHTKALYRCSECNKEYKSKRLLQGHTKEEHEGSKPCSQIYTCDYCKKMFTEKRTMRTHIALVHSSGSYKCHQCNKIFKCKIYLMRHKTRVHPAGSHQLHTCTNCGRKFKSKWHCRRHEKRVKCARPTASNTSAAASTSRQQRNVDIVKEEPADGELDLGPVVFQHMDCNYRPYKLEPGLD